MSYERDAWDEAGDQGNGILGGHIKYQCNKDRWLLDDVEIEVGDGGVKLCVIMPTAIVGEILWSTEGKISDRNVGRIEDGFPLPTPKTLTPGWNVYISVQVVRADEGNLGELATFTASSWGGFYAFANLINPYRFKRKMQFPVCVLCSRDRNDANGNCNPIFKIIGWSDRNNFSELLPPGENTPTPAIAFAPTAPEGYPEPTDGDPLPF